MRPDYSRMVGYSEVIVGQRHQVLNKLRYRTLRIGPISLVLLMR